MQDYAVRRQRRQGLPRWFKSSPCLEQARLTRSSVARATSISNSSNDILDAASGKRIRTWSEVTLCEPVPNPPGRDGSIVYQYAYKKPSRGIRDPLRPPDPAAIVALDAFLARREAKQAEPPMTMVALKAEIDQLRARVEQLEKISRSDPASG
jgi:hypothetical protein